MLLFQSEALHMPPHMFMSYPELFQICLHYRSRSPTWIQSSPSYTSTRVHSLDRSSSDGWHSHPLAFILQIQSSFEYDWSHLGYNHPLAILVMTIERCHSSHRHISNKATTATDLSGTLSISKFYVVLSFMLTLTLAFLSLRCLNLGAISTFMVYAHLHVAECLAISDKISMSWFF